MRNYSGTSRAWLRPVSSTSNIDRPSSRLPPLRSSSRCVCQTKTHVFSGGLKHLVVKCILLIRSRISVNAHMCTRMYCVFIFMQFNKPTPASLYLTLIASSYFLLLLYRPALLLPSIVSVPHLSRSLIRHRRAVAPKYYYLFSSEKNTFKLCNWKIHFAFQLNFE